MVGDLTVDRGQLAVHVGPVTIRSSFTPREFAVHRLSGPPRPDVVTKQALIDAVWGFDFEGDPNIVEVYVGYLRRKLGRDAVRTVRHVGYQITGAIDDAPEDEA